MNLDACIEREEPRLSDSRDFGSVVHFEKDERRALSVVVSEVNSSGSKSLRIDWMVSPSFPALPAAFPASTGMLTFTKTA
jgi:hypothetical protein